MKVIKNISIILIIFLLINIVSSATIVQNTPPQPQEEEKHWYDFISNPLFWGALLFALIIVGLLVAGFFIVRWLVNFIKEQNDIFFKLKKERLLLAKIHSRYPNSNHWWKIEKNTPIRLVKIENGKPYVTKPIAFHRGDYMTHEGNVIIGCNFQGRRKFFILPDKDVIVIPNKEQVKIQQRNQETGKFTEIELKNLPQAKDLVQFNENEILIFAESISKSGYFFMPVIKSKDGKIIDLALPVFSTMRDVALHEYMYDQASMFGTLTKKATDSNPFVRISQKVSDVNNNVEVPQENQ